MSEDDSGELWVESPGTGSDAIQGEPQFAILTGTGATLGLLVGLSLGGAVLFIVVIVVLVRNCSGGKRKNSLDSIDLDDSLTATSKSAPCTRCTTPQVRRKESMPEPRLSVTRSLTVDSIPDFALPPERVQPRAFTRTRSENAMQYQQNFLASFQPQLYGLTRDDDDFDTHAEEDNRISGSLWFSLIYDAAVEQLSVTIIKAKHLKGRGRNNGTRDPFVKVYLLPDERNCQQSRVRKKTLNPKFNETFVFYVAATEVGTCTLRLSMYDVDKRRVRHSLGHVILPLSETDLASGELMVKQLESHMSQNSAGVGELFLSLMWNPSTERCQVTVLKARNLTKLDYDSKDGVCVRVELISGGKVMKTKRTSRVSGGCEPAFNEALSFTVLNKQLETVKFLVTLLTVKTDFSPREEQEYGKVILGSFLHTRGEELIHWQEMLAQPRSPVARWHHLNHTAPTTGNNDHDSS